MASYDYEKMAKKAAIIIAKYGVSIAMERVVSAAGDVGAGTVVESTPVQGLYKGLMLSRSDNKEYDIEIDDDLFQKEGLTFLLSADGTLEPKINDKYTVANTVYNCVGTKKVAPAGISVIYIAGVVAI